MEALTFLILEAFTKMCTPIGITFLTLGFCIVMTKKEVDELTSRVADLEYRVSKHIPEPPPEEYL